MANGWRARQQLISADTDPWAGLFQEGIVHGCSQLLSWRLKGELRRPPVSLNLRAPKLCVISKGLTGPLRGRSKCPVLLQAIGHKNLNLSHSKPALCLSVYAPISWLSLIPGQKGKGIVFAVLVWKDSGVTSLAQSNDFWNIFWNAFPWPCLLECFWLFFCDMALTQGCSGRCWLRCCWSLWPSKAALQCLRLVSNSLFFGSSDVQKPVLYLYFAFCWVFSPLLLTHLGVCTCHWWASKEGRTFSECSQLNQSEFWKE